MGGMFRGGIIPVTEKIPTFTLAVAIAAEALAAHTRVPAAAPGGGVANSVPVAGGAQALVRGNALRRGKVLRRFVAALVTSFADAPVKGGFLFVFFYYNIFFG